MSNSLAQMKKNKKSRYDSLIEATNKMQSGGKSKDDRFWQPTLDEAGNGSAIIRFLPAPKGEDLPWVRIFSHGFKGPGGWYIENSLSTIGADDPLGEFNNRLWNNGTEAGKQQARDQKRKLKYIANILVVKDPKKPENDGQVFLFRFGKKIFDKINDQLHPEFEDESPIDPFDFWEGVNFRMKIRKVEGYRNYDKCEFDSVSTISEDDSEIEEIWGKQYSLEDHVSADKFKTYDELQRKLSRVLALDSAASHQDDTPAWGDDQVDAAASQSTGKPVMEPPAPGDADDGDDAWLKEIQADLEDE